MDHRALRVEDLRFTIAKNTLLRIPLATLQVHSYDVNTVFWRSNACSVFRYVMHHIEIERECVDSNGVLSGVVLHGSGQETMGEEEFVDPVDSWNAFLDPLVKELKPFLQVNDVGAKGLK